MEEVFQVLFPELDQVMSIVNAQKQMTQTVADTVKSYVPKIVAGWTGDDSTAFSQHIQSHFVPDIMALIAAIAGINTNINKGKDIVNNADKQIQGLADQLGGVFDSII